MRAREQSSSPRKDAMEVQDTPIGGLKRIILDVSYDDRGSFREWFHQEKMTALGLPEFDRSQGNISVSGYGTLRGVHAEPWDKYVHVADGTVFAAIADLRPDSPTFGRAETFRLGHTDALFIPEGLGNSFQVISPSAVYCYLVSRHWQPGLRYPAIAYDDPDLAIDWPVRPDLALVSPKDQANPTLREAFPEAFA